MLKIPHIKNFLLLYYKPTEFSEKLLKIKLERLPMFYPHAKIHILTNTDIKCDNATCHKVNFPDNHLAKFHLYELLDEPVM